MKRILYVVIFIFSLFIINNLLRSIYNLWQKNDLISDAASQLEKEKKEHEKLNNELEKVKNINFVEEEARNKLFLVKPGEHTVIIGNEKLDDKKKSDASEKILRPWEEWSKFLFGN